jgi:cytochrome c biogenesis protein CcmG, thiol:disulfide interchange protein DsbE
MLSVAIVTAGAAILLAIVLFGRSHGGDIHAPALRLPPPAERSAAPPFTETSLAGRRVSLAAYRGKPVVINFFAAWCYPCRQEAPEFVRLHRRFGNRIGLVSVAVRTDHRSALDDFVQAHDMTWPVVWDRSGSLIGPYRIGGQPITYLIDPQGRVVFRILGQTTEGRIGGVLDKLLGSDRA